MCGLGTQIKSALGTMKIAPAVSSSKGLQLIANPPARSVTIRRFAPLEFRGSSEVNSHSHNRIPKHKTRMELNLELGDDVETVTVRIAETIAWCGRRADISRPRACFRSPELMPHPLAPGRKWVVSSVHGKRFLALGRPTPKPADDLAGGHLLIYGCLTTRRAIGSSNRGP